MSEKLRSVLDRIEAEQAQPKRWRSWEVPEDIPIEEWSELYLRGKLDLTKEELRVLIEMLPYLRPKLMAVGHTRLGDDFSAKLDRCIQRSEKVRVKLIEYQPPVEAQVVEGEGGCR
jgi:hypothetical protein